MSTNFGVAPAVTMEFAEATNVKLGRMTSFFIPSDCKATCSADVQELKAIACFVPTYFAKSCSNFLPFEPCASQPESRTSFMRFSSSFPRKGFDKGMFILQNPAFLY